jgi:hypothetical protein
MYHGLGFFFFTLVKEKAIMRSANFQNSKLVDFAIGGIGSIFA